MNDEKNFDLAVIGAGPGGYTAAIRAAQLGLQVACIEKNKTFGGTCLNIGCIPSKALLESSELFVTTKKHFTEHGIVVSEPQVNLSAMMARKDKVVKKLTGGIAALFKKNKIESIMGTARLNRDRTITVSQENKALKISAKKIILATGSVPVTLPQFPFTGEKIVDSTGALALSRVPKHLIVIGAGYIGLELGSVYARLGSIVTVIEVAPTMLAMMDQEVAASLQKILAKQGLKFLLGTQVEAVKVLQDAVELTVTDSQKKTNKLIGDTVLVCAGRKPLTQGLGLEEVGIQTDAKGRIAVDENYQTSAPDVFAIGDLIDGPMLAHKASEEAAVAVERMMGHAASINYMAIPSVVYTWPEVAAVGLTEAQVQSLGLTYKTAKFPFLACGRAHTMEETDGFVKLIADKKTDLLLGAHIIGPRASDLIAELTLAIEFSASCEDIARTIHAHPTLAEAVKEAALGLGDGFINL